MTADDVGHWWAELDAQQVEAERLALATSPEDDDEDEEEDDETEDANQADLMTDADFALIQSEIVPVEYDDSIPF